MEEFLKILNEYEVTPTGKKVVMDKHMEGRTERQGWKAWNRASPYWLTFKEFRRTRKEWSGQQ